MTDKEARALPDPWRKNPWGGWDRPATIRWLTIEAEPADIIRKVEDDE